MVTARFGARATSYLSEQSLKRALGIFMLMVAPLVPYKSYFTVNVSTTTSSVVDNPSTTGQGCQNGQQQNSIIVGEQLQEEQQQSSYYQRFLIPGGIGCCSGFLAGLFGVGGGAIVVPALTLTSSQHMDHYEALGTSLCAMILPALVGTYTHYRRGNVVMRIAPALATGAFVGAYFGGTFALSIDESKLKWGFSTLMIALGIRTLLRT